MFHNTCCWIFDQSYSRHRTWIILVAMIFCLVATALSLVLHFRRPIPEPHETAYIPTGYRHRVEHDKGLPPIPLEEKRFDTAVLAPNWTTYQPYQTYQPQPPGTIATRMSGEPSIAQPNIRPLPVPTFAATSSSSNPVEIPSPGMADERLAMINRLLDRGVSGDEITRVVRMFDEGHQGGPSQSSGTNTAPAPPGYDFTSK
jgi:hypothetical protein